MSNQLFRIVYCSRNTMPASDALSRTEIDQILSSARRNNKKCGVTGALLFNRGCFAQVLEGPRGAVEGVYETIACDPRHGNVTLLEAAPVSQRAFANWSMAYSGMIEDDRVNFSELSLAPADGANTVINLLGGLVLREEAGSNA